MEIEITEKKDHPLLSRLEISFLIKHPEESTPKRSEVREGLAGTLNVKKGCVVIDNMKTVFGKSETIGFAKVYSTEEQARSIEREHILVRNSLLTKESKKTETKKASE